ncbi:MAG: hydantoinase/oxoprolinase family protein [Alphaproteobacteria bacterium]|nr:hydantoinase/oxoprolinase family protein [Alphaproteobacteria bacterium]
MSDESGWRIGVDVGGTFTDLVLIDASGATSVFKAPSVPGDPARGVIATLELAAAQFGGTVADILGRCDLFVHGSTIATNTLIECKGAKVGLLTTAGFRDSLEIRRGWRDDVWAHREPNPPVLVPRALRLPVRGRIDADGSEHEALQAEDVTTASEVFEREGVESVAICLFNGFANPDHELACVEALGERWKWVSASSDIAPVIGEYERTSTAVVNAYVGPRTATYLQELNGQLAALGLRRPILLTQNNGGVIPLERIIARPVALLLSGPAAGVGALSFYRQAIGSDNLISMEIGGTSCDAILMHRGDVAVSDEIKVEGYPLALPSVDIHTIGAGGGTIAGVDEAGLLFVGPAGAGAHPGPACYGFGGAEPTVTDALLVLGRLKAGAYAGGAVTLDKALAEAAVGRVVAEPLGIAVDAAALGMIRLLEQHLLHALQRISIQRGHDPRDFTLVAAGGAGPMHGASVGRMLGCRKVYIPRRSGVFCALGMLHTNLRLDFVRTRYGRFDDVAMEDLDTIFRALEDRATGELEASGAPEIEHVREIDLRYTGQSWDVRVPVPGGMPDKAEIRIRFEQEYERLFGHIQPDGVLEMTALRVVGTGILPAVAPEVSPPSTDEPCPTERRSVFLDNGLTDVDVYKGADLKPGHRLTGPALIDEDTTTVLIGPSDALDVDTANNFMIHLSERET